MRSARKKCQAYVESNQQRCKKTTLPGSRYCYLHQSWGVNAVAAILILILGAILAPVFTDIYHSIFPSQETHALSALDEKFDEANTAQTQKLNELLAKQGNENAKEEYLAHLKELNRLYAEKIDNTCFYRL